MDPFYETVRRAEEAWHERKRELDELECLVLEEPSAWRLPLFEESLYWWRVWRRRCRKLKARGKKRRVIREDGGQSVRYSLRSPEEFFSTGPMTLWRAARDLLAEDVREDLRSIEAPTLLIWGEKDPLIPPSVGKLLKREIPSSHLLVLQNAGHVPMFDRPQEFDAALLSFLAGRSVGE